LARAGAGDDPRRAPSLEGVRKGRPAGLGGVTLAVGSATIWLVAQKDMHRTRLDRAVLKGQRPRLKAPLRHHLKPIIVAEQTTEVAIKHTADFISSFA
jgi:hypothetical protein